jgi:hypothetical protein
MAAGAFHHPVQEQNPVNPTEFGYICAEDDEDWPCSTEQNAARFHEWAEAQGWWQEWD